MSICKKAATEVATEAPPTTQDPEGVCLCGNGLSYLGYSFAYYQAQNDYGLWNTKNKWWLKLF